MTADEAAALRHLPAILLREGYVDAYATFGSLHLRRQDVEARLASVPDHLRAMLELWFLTRAVPRARVLAAMSEDELADQLRGGTLVDDAGMIRNDVGVLLPMFGQVLAIPAPGAADAVYFGPDSGALAIRVTPPTGARCLDLCTGTGIMALRAAAARGTVVAVDLDPAAVRWAGRNAVMNALDDVIEVRRGDLWQALEAGERFDFLVASPPSAAVPPRLRCAPKHAGGPDGTELLRRVLDGIPDAVTERGVAQVVGASLGDGRALYVQPYLEALAARARLRVAMTVVVQARLARGERLFDRMVAAYASESGLEAEEVATVLAAHYRELGATHVHRCFLTIACGVDRPGVSISRHDLDGGSAFFR